MIQFATVENTILGSGNIVKDHLFWNSGSLNEYRKRNKVKYLMSLEKYCDVSWSPKSTFFFETLQELSRMSVLSVWHSVQDSVQVVGLKKTSTWTDFNRNLNDLNDFNLNLSHPPNQIKPQNQIGLICSRVFCRPAGVNWNQLGQNLHFPNIKWIAQRKN